MLSQVKQSAFDCFWRPVYSSGRFLSKLRGYEALKDFNNST